jgi:hypothetical protein
VARFIERLGEGMANEAAVNTGAILEYGKAGGIRRFGVLVPKREERMQGRKIAS